MRLLLRRLSLSLILFLPISCREPTVTTVENLVYEVVAEHPHDPLAFTQGLAYGDGVVYEGTGLKGQSSLREVDWKTGLVRRIHRLDRRYFGEGVTLFKGLLYQLTWLDEKGFVYTAGDFKTVREFSYIGQGWGLTHDGTHLIMSNGSDLLTFRNSETFEVVRQLSVRWKGEPLKQLNELEFIDGSVFANVWKTPFIVRIHPETGDVTGVLDLSLLEKKAQAGAGESAIDVLNGIAWKDDTNTLLVTGKFWPLLFEIRLKESGTQ